MSCVIFSAENAYLKAMQEHLLEKAPELEKNESPSLKCGHCQSDLQRLQGWPEARCTTQLSLQKAKDKMLM